MIAIQRVQFPRSGRVFAASIRCSSPSGLSLTDIDPGNCKKREVQRGDSCLALVNPVSSMDFSFVGASSIAVAMAPDALEPTFGAFCQLGPDSTATWTDLRVLPGTRKPYADIQNWFSRLGVTDVHIGTFYLSNSGYRIDFRLGSDLSERFTAPRIRHRSPKASRKTRGTRRRRLRRLRSSSRRRRRGLRRRAT